MNRILVILGLCLGLVTGMTARAEPKLLVLDFELNDLTSLPNTPAEIARTASFRPMLEQALANIGGYRLITLNPTEQAQANPSLGTLFDHNDTAAQLGKTHHADWILVNRHSKPSFLFSYLMTHVIDARTGRMLAGFNLEMKGNHRTVAEHGIRALAGKINDVLVKEGF